MSHVKYHQWSLSLITDPTVVKSVVKSGSEVKQLKLYHSTEINIIPSLQDYTTVNSVIWQQISEISVKRDMKNPVTNHMSLKDSKRSLSSPEWNDWKPFISLISTTLSNLLPLRSITQEGYWSLTVGRYTCHPLYSSRGINCLSLDIHPWCRTSHRRMTLHPCSSPATNSMPKTKQ
jgi:hypothetical protein